MRNTLTVGVDGSDFSLRALDWAVSEAALHDVPLRLLYASLWDHYARVSPGFGTDRPGSRATPEHIVASATERVTRLDPDMDVSAGIHPEDPVAGLLRESQDAFALVLGHRGRGEIADMLLGSTSLTVAARAQCPVIVVRGSASNARGDFSQVTLGVGNAGESSAAVEFAFREAQARDAELRVVHAWRRRSPELPGSRHLSGDASDAEAHKAAWALEEALRAVAREYPKVIVREELPEGRARDALLDACANSDLLVVGARRRSGSVGMQLGPVNHAVLHHAACPVAVVPQHT